MISPASKKSKRALVSPALERECINTVRVLAADMVQAANSGHPGAPMGCAPLAHVLWTMAMDYSPANPDWMGRDRFVLSNGHACALQYVMLYLTGYTGVGMEDLKSFRQVGSKTPGHPENFVTDGEFRDQWYLYVSILRKLSACLVRVRGGGMYGSVRTGNQQRRGNGHGRASPRSNLQPSRLRHL